MIDLVDERKERVEELFSKYALGSIENCEAICKEKNIDVDAIVTGVKPDACDLAKLAFLLGVASAIKKDTKLASYVAYDIGEGIQTLCLPDTEAEVSNAGDGIGIRASNTIKNVTDESDIIDYANLLDFMEMSNEELVEIVCKLSNAVEEVMK